MAAFTMRPRLFTVVRAQVAMAFAVVVSLMRPLTVAGDNPPQSEPAIAGGLASLVAEGVRKNSAKQWDEAAAIFEKALKLDPSGTASRFGLATALSGLGRYRESCEIYERLLAQNPGDARIKNNIAWLSIVSTDLSVKNTERGERLAMEAVMDLHEDPAVWNTLSTAHYEAGRYELAFKAARIALWLARRKGEDGIWEHWELVRRCRRAAIGDGSDTTGDWSW